MAVTSPSSRHLAPVPTGAYMALDALLLAVAAILAAWVVDQVGLGPLKDRLVTAFTNPGFRDAWTLAHVTVVPLTLYALRQYAFVRAPGRVWSFARIALTLSTLDLALLVFLRTLGFEAIEPGFVLANFAIANVLVMGWRALATRRIRHLIVSGKRVRNALIVGTSGLAADVGATMVRDPLQGRRLVGFVGPDTPPAPATTTPAAWTSPEPDPIRQAVVENSLRNPRHVWAAYRGDSEDARRQIIEGMNVEEVFLGPRRPPEEVAAWLRLCQERGVDCHFIPDHHADLGITPSAWQMGPYVLLDVHRRPFSFLGWWVKRGMDVVISLVALLLASPIILACAIAIKLEHPKNNVFYGGRRVGLKGRHFRQWKFVTMRPDADQMREQLKTKNAREGPWFQLEAEDDPRITKVGHFLRRYSLNDIPQLWNVFVGEMSLVGPRPLAADEVSRFIEYDARYFRCFDVKPGVTGLWQISDRSNPSFEYRIQKDFEYIDGWTPWRDLAIMVKTPWAMAKGGR